MTVVGLTVLDSVRPACRLVATLADDVGDVTRAPPGAVPLTVAVLAMLPESTSVCVGV